MRGRSTAMATRGRSASTAKATHSSTPAAATAMRSSPLKHSSRSVAAFSPGLAVVLPGKLRSI